MMRRWLAFVLGVVLVGLPIRGTAAQSPEAAFFGERGPFPVGVREYVIPDATRPLNATLWYPALNPNNLPEETQYDLGFMSIDGRAIVEAAPDTFFAPYPLIVFSHGYGGFRYQSTYLTEHLASYGFVVIALDHPGNTLFDLLGDGRNLGDLAAQIEAGRSLADVVDAVTAHDERDVGMMAESFALRPLDVLRVIDFAQLLTTGDGDLAGVIDGDHIGVTGHSFGGYTAIAAGGAQLDTDALADWCRQPEGVSFDPATGAFGTTTLDRADSVAVCYVRLFARRIAQQRGYRRAPRGLWSPTTDPRIEAVVALAPWNAPVFGNDGLAALDVPLMVQVGDDDRTAVPERDAYRFYTGVSSADKALVVFQGAGHMLFANRNLGIDDDVWDMAQGHRLVNHFATAFFEMALRDDPAAAAALAPDAVHFDGVGYHTTRGN